VSRPRFARSPQIRESSKELIEISSSWAISSFGAGKSHECRLGLSDPVEEIDGVKLLSSGAEGFLRSARNARMLDEAITRSRRIEV